MIGCVFPKLELPPRAGFFEIKEEGRILEVNELEQGRSVGAGKTNRRTCLRHDNAGILIMGLPG